LKQEKWSLSIPIKSLNEERILRLINESEIPTGFVPVKILLDLSSENESDGVDLCPSEQV
jgi:hypothetical protein